MPGCGNGDGQCVGRRNALWPGWCALLAPILSLGRQLLQTLGDLVCRTPWPQSTVSVLLVPWRGREGGGGPWGVCLL
jgi:hypothetical protein